MAKKENNENYRSRKHGLLLYPEDKSHVEALEKIKSYNYALICHDKDTDEKGELKKAHWHVVINFKEARWRTAVAKDLGITPNYIREIGNEEKALEYLIHFNEEDKHQYSVSEVEGPLKKKLERYIQQDDTPEEDKVEGMINYILSQEKRVKVADFALYCAQKGVWDVFRRSSVIFIKILEEHNRTTYETRQHELLMEEERF